MPRKELSWTRGNAPSATSTAVFACPAKELDTTSTPTNGIVIVALVAIAIVVEDPPPLLLLLLPPPLPLLLLLLYTLLEAWWWARIVPLKNTPLACPAVNSLLSMVS